MAEDNAANGRENATDYSSGKLTITSSTGRRTNHSTRLHVVSTSISISPTAQTRKEVLCFSTAPHRSAPTHLSLLFRALGVATLSGLRLPVRRICPEEVLPEIVLAEPTYSYYCNQGLVKILLRPTSLEAMYTKPRFQSSEEGISLFKYPTVERVNKLIQDSESAEDQSGFGIKNGSHGFSMHSLMGSHSLPRRPPVPSQGVDLG